MMHRDEYAYQTRFKYAYIVGVERFQNLAKHSLLLSLSSTMKLSSVIMIKLSMMKLILLSRVLEFCAASFRGRVRISIIQNPSSIYTRERLAKAIFKIGEMEDATKAGNANGTNETLMGIENFVYHNGDLKEKQTLSVGRRIVCFIA